MERRTANHYAEDQGNAEPVMTTTMPSPHPESQCPYRGLIPYGEADAPFFFGRER